MSTAQTAITLEQAPKYARADATIDAHFGDFLPDSPGAGFVSVEARQAYADVYVVVFGEVTDQLQS